MREFRLYLISGLCSAQQIYYEEDSPVVICESDSKSGILRAIAVRVPDQRSLPVVMEL